MTKMKLLVLDEEDTVLFNSQVNRTLYALYRDNADAFTLMWEQQVTSFSSVGRYHHLRAECYSLDQGWGTFSCWKAALS
jgi:hypothetical protein